MRRLAAAVVGPVIVPLALLAALLAACGDDGGGVSTPEDPTPHPTMPDALVIRVVTGGGLVAPPSLLVEVPAVSVYGDGTFIAPGPTTLEYPGAALPNLQQGRISENELQELLDAARAAGLLDDDGPDFGDPGVTDMPSTDITVNADGAEHTISIYALDFADGDDDLESDQRAARERARDFIAALPTDATEPYEPEAVAVLVRPYAAVTDDGPEPATHDWPLGDLADAGEPIESFGTDTRCLAVTGADADAVLAIAAAARAGDVWRSGGADYGLVFRPLLPDETGCDTLRPPFVGT